MSHAEHIVIARVDRLLLGFNVADVYEVFSSDAVLPVPLTAPMVRGLINLRGEVVTVIDVRTMLRAPPRLENEQPIHLVVRHKREFLSLEVDEVLEVATVTQNQYAARPDSLNDVARRFADGIVQRERDLVMVVNVEQLFDRSGARDERKEDTCTRW